MHNNIMAAGQPIIDESPAVEEQIVLETFSNITPENKAHYDAEKETIHLILTRIGDDIYSTVDACKTAHEMWIAIEKLQQGESLNKQYVKISLFWEFGRFTLRDGESIESYYSRFYKMMNGMMRNQLEVATMQVNVQFLQQLQPEWNKGKEIAKPIIPLSESASKEDSDPEQAQRDKDMQKNLTLIAKSGPSFDAEPLEKVYSDDDYNVFANKRHHSEQPVSINNTCVVEKVDINVIPDSSNMCDNYNHADQNVEECDDERVVLANLIANLKLKTDENKKIQKQLKKANTSLSHELQKCKSALKECKSSLENSNRTLIELEIDA
ncbi:hypothetical protein Tco_1251034 [Tanacetum coccineum]